MRIPRCACGNAESERMVFRQTEIIRKSFIYKMSAPDGSAYQVYAGITSRVARNCASRARFDADSCPGEAMAGILHPEIRFCSTARQLSKSRR